MNNAKVSARPSISPEVHGHRGCRGLYPENTLPAFLHAIALGVEVLELDVVISQDHQVVVSHEPWLSAKLGRDALGQLIDPTQEQQHNLYQMPYEAIRQCVVGEWPHPDFPEQQPVLSYRPLLREVLLQAIAAGLQAGRNISFSVELKSSPEGDYLFHPEPEHFVGLVVAELEFTNATSRTTLLSFDQRILQVARQSYPTLPLCLLVEDSLPPVSALFDTLGFEPEVLGPDFQLLSAEVIQTIRATYPNLNLVPWTVNSQAEMALAKNWQVDAITTDYPNRLLKLLDRS